MYVPIGGQIKRRQNTPKNKKTKTQRELLRDADLRLAAGKRYGLLGPNGRGKSTLLRFLAARELPVPAAVDVLLVEQEVRSFICFPFSTSIYICTYCSNIPRSMFVSKYVSFYFFNSLRRRQRWLVTSVCREACSW